MQPEFLLALGVLLFFASTFGWRHSQFILSKTKGLGLRGKRPTTRWTAVSWILLGLMALGAGSMFWGVSIADPHKVEAAAIPAFVISGGLMMAGAWMYFRWRLEYSGRHMTGHLAWSLFMLGATIIAYFIWRTI